MTVRFYFDADLIGVAKLLVQARSDVTFAGDPGGIGPDKRARPACPISPETKDEVWIPQAAGHGWVVISRDRHIKSRPAERRAIVDNEARFVTLDASKHQLNKWLQLEIIVCQWRKIENLAELPGPWIYTASRTGLYKVL